MTKIRVITFNNIKKLKEKILEIINSHTSNNDIHVDNSEREKWNNAYSHSTSSHAPTDAEKNIIVGVKSNGNDLAVDETTRTVNVTIPTKLSELKNDVGYASADKFATTDVIGNLSDLSTNNKDSLVSAINELKQQISDINAHTYIVVDK